MVAIKSTFNRNGIKSNQHLVEMVYRENQHLSWNVIRSELTFSRNSIR